MKHLAAYCLLVLGGNATPCKSLFLWEICSHSQLHLGTQIASQEAWIRDFASIYHLSHTTSSILLTSRFFVIIAKADVEKLLKASGVTSDAESLDVMMSKLEGKSIPELIKEGSKDLATMGGGGGAAPAGGAGGAGPA